tara:strand:+ start:222 stop:1292 length:1071 start_codon:yes stop_codon:yes gene_type:complete
LRVNNTHKKNILPITLVIPHRNRADEIKRCLQSLQKSYAIPQTIFIIDDCSYNRQQQLLGEIVSEFSNISIKLFCFNQHVGTSDAKNLGLLYSTTPYIWFLDSDTEIINPDALELGFQLLEKHLDIGVVGSEIVEDRNLQRYLRETYLLKSLWSTFIHHPINNNFKKEVDITPTCNFLTRTNLIKEIGGFHSKLENGEDKLACLQIRKLKYKIIIDSQFGVLHHQSPTARAQFLKRVRVTFRDIAFIYGATNKFWELITYPVICIQCLNKLYKNNMEMYHVIGHHNDNPEIMQTPKIYDFFKKLLTLIKILIQYVLANKTYMSIKGFYFHISNRNNFHNFEDNMRKLPMKLKEIET